MSCVLPPKPHSLAYLERTLFHQPIVDFPLEHLNISKEIICSKAVRRCNLVKVLGQQPRYQHMPSSVTLWQLFHGESLVSSWHHKLLTRQLLPTYTPWRRWDHRPQNKRGIAREDSGNKGSFRNKGQGIQIQQQIWFKEIQVFCWTSAISWYSVLHYHIMVGLLASKWWLSCNPLNIALENP